MNSSTRCLFTACNSLLERSRQDLCNGMLNAPFEASIAEDIARNVGISQSVGIQDFSQYTGNSSMVDIFSISCPLIAFDSSLERACQGLFN